LPFFVPFDKGSRKISDYPFLCSKSTPFPLKPHQKPQEATQNTGDTNSPSSTTKAFVFQPWTAVALPSISHATPHKSGKCDLNCAMWTIVTQLNKIALPFSSQKSQYPSAYIHSRHPFHVSSIIITELLYHALVFLSATHVEDCHAY